MTHREFELLTGLRVPEYDYQVVERVYNYLTDRWPDKQSVARSYCEEGMLRFTPFLAQANKAALEADGALPVYIPRVEWYGTEWSNGMFLLDTTPASLREAWENITTLMPTHLRDDLDYWAVTSTTDADTPWPIKARWIAVYVVPGGSEGYYLHVDAIVDDTRQLLLLAKTLGGIDTILPLANWLTTFFANHQR
jgi:hypothetical protein